MLLQYSPQYFFVIFTEGKRSQNVGMWAALPDEKLSIPRKSQYSEYTLLIRPLLKSLKASDDLTG
jgi:hypothetical protein